MQSRKKAGIDDDSYKQVQNKSYIGINWLEDRDFISKLLNLCYQLCRLIDASFWFYFVPIVPVILSFDLPEKIQANAAPGIRDFDAECSF